MIAEVPHPVKLPIRSRCSWGVKSAIPAPWARAASPGRSLATHGGAELGREDGEIAIGGVILPRLLALVGAVGAVSTRTDGVPLFVLGQRAGHQIPAGKRWHGWTPR